MEDIRNCPHIWQFLVTHCHTNGSTWRVQKCMTRWHLLQQIAMKGGAGQKYFDLKRCAEFLKLIHNSLSLSLNSFF